MTHKLLLITAGTVAAGVGVEFMKQVKMHPASELQAVVRYIDTALLTTRYSGLRSGEWFQMTINPQFMDSVRRNKENYPYLKDLLYPGFLPEIQGSGGGSIRYNAAGAIAINRERMKGWLTTSINDLVRGGGGQVKLSIALVVSSVGATGSGALERLVDMVVECSLNAQIPPPLHCDVFILQPGAEGVTDLGLSNTLALYAEMAASRLSRTITNSKSYRGRTIMVGWGSEHSMGSIEQLTEAAATLVRLTHDPVTDIAAEFQDREIDNHVLREQDWQTQLPSHLSSATAVTISLGDLEEKIIQRDAVRLVDTLVFGGKPAESASGDYFIPGSDKAERTATSLLGTLLSFLQGETPEDRYRHLVGRLTEGLTITSLQTTTTQLKDRPVEEQANRLRQLWQYDKEEIAKHGRSAIQKKGAELAGIALNDIRLSRRTAIANGASLRDLRDEYRVMEDILISTLAVPPESNQGIANDKEVISKVSALERAIWNKERALQQALAAVQGNVEQALRRESHTAAVEVLKLLQDHCAGSLRNLEIVLQKFLKQRKTNPRWAAADQNLRIDMDHLLHMAALSTPAEITRYADLVSIFASQNRRRTSAAGAIGRIIAGDEQKVDQLAAFRKWLDDQNKLDALFAGETDVVLDLAQHYASRYVHDEVKEHSVVDVLLQAGEEILHQRLREAAEKANPLVRFDPPFASELREARHLSAFYKDEEQRGLLVKAINQAFGQGQCTLLSSKDPSEIVIFYYMDGLPMSAVTDLTGRCLGAFLKRRLAWKRQSNVNGTAEETNNLYKQRVGVPVYSGKDAQERVLETGVINQLYKVRGQNVDTYAPGEIPELDDGKHPQ